MYHLMLKSPIELEMGHIKGNQQMAKNYYATLRKKGHDKPEYRACFTIPIV